jgi:PBP1b-binding outer membrane lipoprotein LpoB
MKKLLFVFTALLLFSCSSDNSAPQSINDNSNNLVLNGQTFNFDTAELTKLMSVDGSGYVDLILSNTAKTHTLTCKIKINLCNTCGSYIFTDFKLDTPITYQARISSNSYLSNVSFKNNITPTTYTTIFTNNDFIEYQSRIIVTKHSDTTYSFNLNFITTLGTINGNYTGLVKKIGFN